MIELAAYPAEREIFSYPLMVPGQPRTSGVEGFSLGGANEFPGKPIVLSVAPGGVEAGLGIAEFLGSDFSPVFSRALPFPKAPSSSFGAVAEDGSLHLLARLARGLPLALIESIVAEQRAEIRRAIASSRRGEDLPEISGRTVVLIGDEPLLGPPIKAAFRLCRLRGAGRIVLSGCRIGPHMREEIEKLVEPDLRRYRGEIPWAI
jgi:putative phosphoribosyl transferase